MGANAGGVRAGKAYVELYADKSPLVRGLKDVKAHLLGFASTAATVAAGVAVAAGTALAAGLATSVKLFADVGSKFVDMADRTGASVEALSTLEFAAGQTGASLDDVEAGMRKLAKSGKFAGMKSEDAFRAALRQVAAIQDPLSQAQLAMELFGKSGTSLIPMAKDLEALEARARALGLEMSEGDAQAADALGDAWGELVATATALGVKIGSVLAPALQTIVEWGTEVVGTVGKWIESNREIIESFVRVATSGDVLWAGIQLGAQNLVNNVYAGFLGVEKFLLDVWDTVLDGALVALGELKKAWNDFGAWLSETMQTVGATVFEVQTDIAGKIGAAFLRATGNEQAAQNLEDFNKAQAGEREQIARENGPRKRPAAFDQIDAETAAARARLTKQRKNRGDVFGETLTELDKLLEEKRRDFDNAYEAALRGPAETEPMRNVRIAADAALQNSTAMGTFSASAAAGMAGSSQLDEVVNNGKQHTKLLKRIADKQGGIQFT